jgi:RHS repeat-associated protein
MAMTCADAEFTAKERDAETGLDFFGARYMSSAQGRFTSPDVPLIDEHTNDPQSWNLYAYVRNNPLKLIDPNGLDCVYANDNGGGVGIVDQHSNSNECGGHGGTWVPGKVNYGENGSANYNQDTGMFQVASNDGKNVYYSTFAAGATTNEAGKCVGGNCNGADIQHADASWLSGMAGGNIDQMMHFMVNRDTPIHGVLLNNSAGAIGEQILSGPLAFWNNHWAGPGRMGAPHGRGDWAAMAHDFNFDRNGITIGSYFDPIFRLKRRGRSFRATTFSCGMQVEFKVPRWDWFSGS